METRNLDPPKCVVERIEQLQVENEPLSGWLAEKGFHLGHSNSITTKEAYGNFVQFCKDNGYRALGIKEFCNRLREARYTVERVNGDIGNVLYSNCKRFRRKFFIEFTYITQIVNS